MKILLVAIFFFFFFFFFEALINNANTEDNNIDTQWMQYLIQSLTLNTINIPGTYDSGTYYIGRMFVS